METRVCALHPTCLWYIPHPLHDLLPNEHAPGENKELVLQMCCDSLRLRLSDFGCIGLSNLPLPDVAMRVSISSARLKPEALSTDIPPGAQGRLLHNNDMSAKMGAAVEGDRHSDRPLSHRA